MRTLFSLWSAAASFALASEASAQHLTQTLPAGFETEEGNAATSYPFDTAWTQRWHWVYASEEFEAAYPIRIEEIELRPDGAVGSWPLVGYRNLEIRLGTAAHGYEWAGYQPAFDANWTGGSGTLFFAGIAIVYAGTGSAAAPNPWTLRISGTPFEYDPRAGLDLIVDVRTIGLGQLSNPLLHSIDAQSGPTGTNGGNRYGHRSDPLATHWDFSNDELVPILRITYSPADGLYPDFEATPATPTTGPSPLAVSFTDRSVSSAPGGVTSWAWDFDGDSVIDSTSSAPSFVYSQCGRYDVSLTVTDSAHPAATKTETGFVTVDPATILDARFDAHPQRGIVPFPATFYDRSLGTATSWEWDLDGDGVADSTLAEPWFTYFTPGEYTVRLTVRNACSESTVTRTRMIRVLQSGANLVPDLLQYQFDEIRGTAVANTASTSVFPSSGLASAARWMGDPGPRRSRFGNNPPGFGVLGAHPVGGAWVDTGAALDLRGSSTLLFWLRRRPESTGANPFGYVLGDGRFRIFLGGIAGESIGFRGSVVGDCFAGRNLISDTEWHHVALVIDDVRGVAAWTIDGVPDWTVRFVAGTFAYAGLSNLSIGASAGASPLTAHFDLDDVRWVSGAASAEDVAVSSWGEIASVFSMDPACTVAGNAASLETADRPRTPSIPTFSIRRAEPLAAVIFCLSLDAHLGGALPLPLPGFLEPGCTIGVLPGLTLVLATDVLGEAALPLAIPDEPLLWTYDAYVQALILGTRAVSTNVLDLNLQRH